MRDPLSSHRRAAKALKRAVEAQQPAAMARWRAVHGDDPVSHTGALHVIARDAGFASWPRMKFALETEGLDRAALQARLASALINGQHWRVEALLAQDLDLPASRRMDHNPWQSLDASRVACLTRWMRVTSPT